MGKGARNKNQAPTHTKEVHETLTNTITSFLGPVSNMSLRLDEISSTVNGLVNISKNMDEASGRTTTAKSVIAVDSKRDIVGEFRNLRQTTTVAEYREKFEELRDWMVKIDYGLSEGYLIYSFLTGLNQEIKCSIGSHKPESLYHAYDLARIQEISIEKRKDKETKETVVKDKLKSSRKIDPSYYRKQAQAFLIPGNPLDFLPLVHDIDNQAFITEKRARNKNQAPAQAKEVNGIALKGEEAKLGTLTNTIKGLLGDVKNMSQRLDEISSTVNGLVNCSKNVDAASGKSTIAEPGIAVDPELYIVREFHDLKQITSVADYQEKFEKLRDLIVQMNYGLSEGYLISCFLSGLKQEIKQSVVNREPRTLFSAFNLARIQETALEEMTDEETRDKLMKEKLKSLGRDEPNLQCKQVSMFISRDDPLKIRAFVGEKKVTILISTGMEYSYIDTSLAITAGCKIEEAEPLRVNFLKLGYQAVSRFRCPKLEWTMQGHKFEAEMRVVEIKGACDIVLGADWVHKNTPLAFTTDGILLKKDGEAIVLLNKSKSTKLLTSRMLVFGSDGIFIKEGEKVTPISSTYMGLESMNGFKGMLSSLDYLISMPADGFFD
ncbi:OLC1v1000377C1 [Oldenlandia corymbosa var. corymbosa]|uniref:OLC1v1000377C1 n=1 Tax=Oldenlandia corymbosa var. corymbosa TaxID=529605 RepID=A0AAV1D351_OLDCO|nr:OLC1v1000377C1 [Oldenlandia corymbosa var. corymbosa]